MMKPNIRYLILPDVHGRDFWVKPVEEALADPGVKIIFEGDFHDPYPWEFENEPNYLQKSIDNFKEILNIKQQNPERVTLLIGNHDCGYAISEEICSSRMDYRHKDEIGELFTENWELFQLADECEIAGRHFIFSHAGIHKKWAERVFGKDCDDVVNSLNEIWKSDNRELLYWLGDYDAYRGWGGCQYGSLVWSDIRSWAGVTPEESFGFHIVGHTQLESDSPVILDTIADLDCRKAFYLDSSGDIRDWDTDKVCKKI